MAESTSKRQRITHLELREWVLERPDAYIGGIEPKEHTFHDFSQERPSAVPIVVSPALVGLAQELVSNALDNCQRDDTQRYIKLSYSEGTGTFAVSNDGSTLPIEWDEKAGAWAPTLAFGTFQSGSNFDVAETGTKETAFTAGRNGVGSKGCNVFSARFAVRVCNAADKKTFAQAWERNMSVRHAPVMAATTRKTNETIVEWSPDFTRLGGDEGARHMPMICRWLAHNASLCAPPSVKVFFGGELVKLRSPEHFCRALGGTTPLASDTVAVDGKAVLRICTAARESPSRSDVGGLTYAFVNGTPCREGSHAKYIFSKLTEIVDAKAQTKRGAKNVHVTPSFLQAHSVTVAVLLVERERFTDQRKRCLDAPVRDWGWKWDVGMAFRSAVERSPLADRLLAAVHDREDGEAAKLTKTQKRPPSIAKYEPALRRHTGRTTLIVCEGDSAGNLVRSGLTVVGRQDYGLYPLRGKFLNARGLGAKAVLENKEALELLQILGIQLNAPFTAESVKKLPYAHLMAMTDQDVDGSHIMGLLFNLIDACAPTLLAHKSDYLKRFATSLIRVSCGREEFGFYSQSEYDLWLAARRADGAPVGTAKYFKGLGTSSAEQARSYFRNLRANTITMVHGPGCADALDLAFNKKRADDRKAFLTSRCDPDAHVDYSRERTTVTDFVHNELLPQYALASLRRAIPSLDGFKEAHRKVFFGARSLKLTSDISVANAAGKISSHTHYHHRGTAMEDTIIGMAADYAGTSNINLILPHGQFGTRHKHAAASAAYPKIALNRPIEKLLFPPADDPVLERMVDEGKEVEPRLYPPVIATPLVFGCKGIATGWSTDVPNFHPLDIIKATERIIDGDSGDSAVGLRPWYRGFDGPIEKVDDKTFVVRGVGHWDGADYHITELPPFRETEAYKEDWTKLDVASGGIFPGDGHTDERVHLVLKGCKPLIDPIDALGLTKKLSLGNMHLLDATGSLKRYDTVDAILRDHAEFRLGVYAKRIDHELNEARRGVLISQNKARFVGACIAGDFDLRCFATTEEAEMSCEARGYDRVGGSYDYLLNLPMRALTAAAASRFDEDAHHERGHMTRLAALTPASVWKTELRELAEHLGADPRYVVRPGALD